MSLRCKLLGHRWTAPSSLDHCCRCPARRSPPDGVYPRVILNGGTMSDRMTNLWPMLLLVLVALAATIAVVAVGNASLGDEEAKPPLEQRMSALKPLPDAVQYWYRSNDGRQDTAEGALLAPSLPKGKWIKETCTLAADNPEAVVMGTELIAHCRYTVVTRDEAVSFVTTGDPGPAA